MYHKGTPTWRLHTPLASKFAQNILTSILTLGQRTHLKLIFYNITIVMMMIIIIIIIILIIIIIIIITTTIIIIVYLYSTDFIAMCQEHFTSSKK